MALTLPPRTPPFAIQPNSTAPPTTDFNIISHYKSLTSRDANHTPAIAAIESLIALLSSNPLTTISETLALLSHQSQILLLSQPNPIPLSAGTDLFQRYLISSFQHRSLSHQHGHDFTSLRNQLISNSKLFVSRAKQASSKIAQHGLPFIREDSTIFSYGTSNVITTLLSHATDSNRHFSSIAITSPTSPDPKPNPDANANANANTLSLQRTTTHPQNPTSTIPLHALATAFSSLRPSQHATTLIIIPATAVLESGAILSALGTHTLAILAKSFHIPVYVAVESFKFVRNFPLGTGEGEVRKMGARQRRVLPIPDGDDDEEEERELEGGSEGLIDEKDMQEIVPAEFITALITENGVMTTEGVSEELIKLWF